MNKLTKILGFVRSIFNTEHSCEYFIKNVEESFYKHKESFPGYDQHFYLMQSWLAYMTAKGANIDDPAIKMAAPATTYLTACTPPSYCARALGIFLLYKERGEAIPPKVLEEFNKVMLPVFEAQANETIEQLYRKYNPRMAEQTAT
ncbi:MAG: hypothetical protein V1690_00570 [Candidatus Moraniibacteriota bacterium]